MQDLDNNKTRHRYSYFDQPEDHLGTFDTTVSPLMRNEKNLSRTFKRVPSNLYLRKLKEKNNKSYRNNVYNSYLSGKKVISPRD